MIEEKRKVEASPDPGRVMEEVEMDRKSGKDEDEEEEVRMGCYITTWQREGKLREERGTTLSWRTESVSCRMKF
ncbi:hypothetical protein Pyn_39600 [Prunus yedoensis var. nudiflora]|uniref:Uncharacterized protein n=1 Tax=Prunus yedoensis var. nudiflora TaxID=2094558 RepID=A0A314Z125_PRUYE|nr:hypothetical protein Pyn_39600 [Prunus yedoensis var. nudiflora]